MFERSVFLGDQESRRPWTFSVSLLAQALLVVIALLVPLLSKPLMPVLGAALVSLQAPRPPRSAPPSPPQTAVAPTPEVFQGELRQPREIPDDVAMVDVPREASPDVPFVEGGDPNGLSGRVISELISGIPIASPPPPPAPETEVAPEPAAVRVSSTVQAARILHRVRPAYPEIARRAGIGGVVRLQAVIAADGTIEQLEVIDGHPLLISAAIGAVSQWRYRPVLLAGVAVPVNTQIDVNFKIR